MAAANPNPAQSLQAMIKPLLVEMETSLDNRLGNRITGLSFDIMTEIKTLHTRLAAFEKAQSAPKKAGKKAKEGEAAADGEKKEGDTPKKEAEKKEGDETTAEEGDAKSGKFPNKMLWFKAQYKGNEQFRKECNEAILKINPTFLTAMEDDKGVASKKGGEAKDNAKASFAWKFIGAHAKTNYLDTTFAKIYEDAKKKAESAAKPAANQPEAVTPKP